MSDERVRPITDAEASPEVRAIFEACLTLIGRVPNLIRIVAHSPQQARWLVALMATVQRVAEGTVLDGRLRELAILKASTLNACAY
jgi:alkylhydroperoxidase family enzyme